MLRLVGVLVVGIGYKLACASGQDWPGQLKAKQKALLKAAVLPSWAAFPARHTHTRTRYQQQVHRKTNMFWPVVPRLYRTCSK